MLELDAKQDIIEVSVGMDNVIVEGSIDGEGKARGGDVVVEGSTDGEVKAGVGEEAALKGTTGDTITEGNTDAELTTQVGEEDASKEIVGSTIVEECAVQVGEEGAPNGTAGHTIVGDSSDVERTTPVGEESLEEKMDNAFVEESAARVGEETSRETVGDVMVIERKYRHNAQVSEEVLNKMVCDDTVVENAEGKHKTPAGGKEMLSETVGSVIFEESADGENKAQFGKEEVLNETMGNRFVKESADGEHMAQARGAEVLNEATGSVIAKENTVVEYRAQVEEEEVLNGTVGNVSFEESTVGEREAEVRKAAAMNETMGDIIIEESTDGEVNGEASEAAAVNETIDGIEGSTDVEHMAQIGVEEEANERMDSLMVEESTDGEPKAQVINEEILSETEKQAVQSMASGAMTIPLMENDQYVSYHLPSLTKPNFSVSDLVWGKVKSHPWWPGQIFDLSDATKLAMKYQKKDSFLIGYFGDKTFAWCDESQLKPFHSYFSQLEKQCSSDTFVKAIHDILTEVARRVSLGMACSCLSEEDFTNVKYQKVENAGIRGGNINSIIDRSTVANYFQPARLLEYIQTLARFPNGIVDRLELVIARSQLKAFYHLKGYPELPVFTVSGGLVECIPENSPSDVKRTMEDVTQRSMEDISEHCTPIPSNLFSAQGKSRSEQEHGFMEDDKQKSISKLKEVRTGVHLENGAKSTFVAKAAKKPISSSGKKHVIVETDLVDSGRCKKIMMDSFEDTELKSPSPTVASSFRIGEFICRAASQLTGGPPIVKCQAHALQKCGPQADHKKDDIARFDVFHDSHMGNQTTNLSFIDEDNSTEELLSQLCLAARSPMDGTSFVSAIVAFFTGFRNYCVSISSEDNEHAEEHVEEHVEKRKRGRPRKVIAQVASAIVSSDDEKHVEKRKRGMMSKLAYSDISSEEEKPIEKPVEKRKRGRPRKTPQPDSSDPYEDKKPVQKLQRVRPRSRPKKVDTHLALPDYNSPENKKPIEKRKRGRPRKVNTEIVPSNMPTPDNMKDSYWSDMDLQQKRNGKGHMQYRRKRRKSTGEQSFLFPPNPVQEIERQMQLIAMNPNLKLTFIEERSIVSVEEKIVDECIPTALILSFNNANSLPSETDLIRIFSRYGPLKETETDVLRNANRAKVVFKRRIDAEAAFSSAGKYSIFGPGLLSYQLKSWTPGSTMHVTLQDTQDTASTLTPQGAHDTSSILTQQDTHDVAHITTPPENPDVVSIMTPTCNHDAAPIATPQDNYDMLLFTAMQLDTHDLGSITTAQDHRDLAPITMVLDNDSAAVIITPQDKCDAEPTAQRNFVFSVPTEAMIASDDTQIEVENVESLPYDKKYPVSIKSQQGNQDAVLVASPLDASDLAPTSIDDKMDSAPITIMQENHDAAGIIQLPENCVAVPDAGSMLGISAQAEDVIASDTKLVDAEGKESSSPNDNSDQVLFVTPQEIQVKVHVVSPPTSTQDKLNAAPIIMVQDNSDAASIIRLTIGNNVELSGKAEDAIASDSIRVETESKGSSPNDKHDSTPVSTHKENQDSCHVSTAIDEQYVIPSCTQGVDTEPISMEQDHHDATAIITLGRCIERPTVGNELHLSEQAEVVIVSDIVQVEAVDMSTPPHCSDCIHDSAMIDKGPEQYQDAIPIASQLDEHDLKAHNGTQDNLDTTPIAMVQDYHNAATIITPQDNCDAGQTVEINLELSEQAEDGIALDTMEVEPDGKESLPEYTHNPILATKPFVLRLDNHDSTPNIQENLDAPTISMPHGDRGAELTPPQDNHDSEPIVTPSDNHDAEPIMTPQDNQVAEPIVSLPQDNRDAAPITPSQDYHDAVSIAAALDHYDAAPIGKRANHHEAYVATPQDKHDLAQISAVQDCHELAPIAAVQDNPQDVVFISLQVKHEAGHTTGSNSKHSGQSEDVITTDTVLWVNDHDPEQPEDATMQDTIQVEAEGKKSLPENTHDPAVSASEQKQDTESIPSLAGKDDSRSSTTEDNLDAAPISIPLDNSDPQPVTTAQNNQDEVSITTHPNHPVAPTTTPQDNLHATSMARPDGKHHLAPNTQAEDSHGLPPIPMVEDNHDAATVVALEDKCDAGPTVESNVGIPVEAKDVMAYDTLRNEHGDKDSLPEPNHTPPTTDIPLQNQGAESVASLVNEHDSPLTITEDNLNGALTDMREDNHDAAPITTQDTSDASITGGDNFKVSESGVASETVQTEPEGCKLDVSEQVETGMESDDMQA